MRDITISKNTAIRVIPGLITGLVFAAFASGAAKAEIRQYCISCKGPDQTYLCQVETPNANLGDKGLQLYCIIRTSKDGGHKSCAVQSKISGACDGPVKAYTFQVPAIPTELRSARKSGPSGISPRTKMPNRCFLVNAPARHRLRRLFGRSELRFIAHDE